MSLVENLQTWQDAVHFYNEGDFQKSLEKFQAMKDPSAKITFNIGRVYMSLCEIQMSLEAFQVVIRKDSHLAVGHFMLGVANLMCTKHHDALINFDEALRKLRGSKSIDYKQLGMRYKLYKCEVLLNRAVCLSSLGYIESATEDLVSALQCKVEPRHNIIDISLEDLQNGKDIEFIVMDSIFQPPKSKTANLEKRDYLGKAQVVVDAYEIMIPPAHGKSQPTVTVKESVVEGELYKVLYDFHAQNSSEISVKAGDIISVIEKAEDGWFTMVTKDGKGKGLVPGTFLERVKEDVVKENKNQTLTNRQALLSDLRKIEARQSLRRVQPSQTEPSTTKTASSKTHNKHRPVTISADDGYQNTKVTTAVRVRHSTAIGDKITKITRSKSLEILLGNSPPVGGAKSPTESPLVSKKPPGMKETPDDSDEDDYIDIEEDLVAPYAVNDILPPGKRPWKTKPCGPERPKPPPKMGVTLKPRPRVDPPNMAPRSNTLSNNNVVPNNPPPAVPNTKPVKKPPKLPSSPLRLKKNKEKAQKVTVEFIVSTTLELTSKTSQEEIRLSGKNTMVSNNCSELWCEKDGKKIRLNDTKVTNVLDLVKDGKLRLWCNNP